MSSESIIQEVDDELRRDRIRKLWRQLGPFVIGAAVLVVLVVAGYEGWTWWQKTQSSKSSDLFYSATKIADGTDFDAAKTALDGVIKDGSGGYPMLAQFRQAALLAQQGKTDEAVAAYDGLSSSVSNTHLRELALILAGNLLIDKADVGAVQQRVGGSLTPESPLRNAAREVLGLAQYKAGKLDDAMTSFNAIMTDPGVTSDIRSRIQIFMLQLVAEGAKPIVPPDASSSAPASDASASAEPSAAVSSASAAPASTETSASASEAASASASVAPVASASDAASTAVDASTALDVAAPVDDKTLSLAVPAETLASASSAVEVTVSSAVSMASDISSSTP